MRKALCFLNQLGITHSESSRDFELCLDLAIRSPCNTQELPEFPGTEPALPFRNIAWHRDRGAPDLTRESVNLFSWKILRQTINRN